MRLPGRRPEVPSAAYLAQQEADRVVRGVVAFYALCPCGCGEDLQWLTRKIAATADVVVPECAAAALIRKGERRRLRKGAGV